jgi:hypothetical protein
VTRFLRIAHRDRFCDFELQAARVNSALLKGFADLAGQIGCANSLEVMFTLMVRGGLEGNSLCQDRRCWQASRNSCRFMGIMSPISSATAMKLNR